MRAAVGLAAVGLAATLEPKPNAPLLVIAGAYAALALVAWWGLYPTRSLRPPR